jgi:hypothetical protein
MGIQTYPEPVLLRYFRKDQKIVVEPEDEDRFVITMREAVAACGAYLEELKFREQFFVLLNQCGAWIDKHKKQIAHAYITIQDGGVLFLVIQKGKARDSSLSNDLSALDIEIANNDNLSLLDVSVLVLPKGTKADVNSFINHEFLLKYSHAK